MSTDDKAEVGDSAEAERLQQEEEERLRKEEAERLKQEEAERLQQEGPERLHLLSFLDPARQTINEHSNAVLPVLVLAIGLLIVYFLWPYLDPYLVLPEIRRLWVVSVVTSVVGAAFFVSFIVIFTGHEPSLSSMSRFAYTFTVVAVVGLTIPFFGFFLLEPWAQTVERAPMALLIGCVVPATSSELPNAPQEGELACGEDSRFQWVISIGGTTTPVGGTAAPEENPPRWRPVQIQGGLVVPLYFVVLSVMGAAVGMMRQVPEYQRTARDAAEAGSDSSVAHDARKNIVFQILQVVSAPLIAIVAYTLISPESIKSTAAIGFAAGFGAEPILLMIGAVASALAPKSAT